MMVYAVFFISVIYVCFFDRYLGHKKTAAAFMLAVAFLLSTFRSYLMGADYDSYIGLYDSNSYKVYSWGYQLMNYLAKQLGNSYICLAFAINILIFSCVFACYMQQVRKEYLAFAIFLWLINPYGFIQSSFNMLRQGCAMAVLLAASGFLGNKAETGTKRIGQYLMFFLLLFCAAGFHKSAWIFVLLVPFTMIRWRWEFHAILLLVCAGINILARDSTFMGWIARQFGFEDYVSFWGGSIFDFPVYTLFIICFAGFLILNYRELFVDQREKWYVDLYICSLCVLLLLVKNDQAYRLYVYLFYITVISVTIIMKNVSMKIRQCMALGYTAYYSLMFWGFLIMQKIAQNIHYYPFTFFWQLK